MAEARTMKASEVRDQWSETVDSVARGEARVRIERSGTPVAGLVSARDLEWLALRDRHLEELRATILRMRQAFADIPEGEIEAEVARALGEVRAESVAHSGTEFSTQTRPA
jgi:prevent-host-death family protein